MTDLAPPVPEPAASPVRGAPWSRPAARQLRQAADAIATRVADAGRRADAGAGGRDADAGAADGRRRDAIELLDHLARAIDADSPALFAEQMRWAELLRRHHDGDGSDLGRDLRAIDGAIGIALAPDAVAVARSHLAPAMAQLQTLGGIDTFIDPGAPRAALARDYLDALLAGDRHRASRLVLDAVDAGTPIRAVYLDVFQRTQWEIGRLWQLNRISVAQEHFCTAATQLVMSQLYDRIFATERIGRTLVATCATHDLHELGIRMVSDFFEMEGWDTHYLGADTPVDAIVDTCVAHRADVLAVSLTIAAQLPQVVAVIDAIRADERCARVRVLVGGQPFAVDASLWRRVGADATAVDASGAVVAVDRLLAAEGR